MDTRNRPPPSSFFRIKKSFLTNSSIRCCAVQYYLSLVLDYFLWLFEQHQQTITMRFFLLALLISSLPFAAAFWHNRKAYEAVVATATQEALWAKKQSRRHLESCPETPCGEGKFCDFADADGICEACPCGLDPSTACFDFDLISDAGQVDCLNACTYMECEGCNICGEDGTLAYPETTLNLGEAGDVTCQLVSDLAIQGFLPECGSIAPIVSIDCCDEPVPGPFPNCPVCPDDTDVTNPDALLEAPDGEDGEAATCADVQMSGRAGFIPNDMCSLAQIIVPSVCGCQERAVVSEAPSAATEAPTAATEAPTVVASSGVVVTSLWTASFPFAIMVGFYWVV